MTMTPPVVNPVTLDPSVVTFRAPADIQPFSYRDTDTYLTVLNNMRRWLYNNLVPYLNTNFTDLQGGWETNVSALDDTINAALAQQATNINNALSAQQQQVANSLATTLNEITSGENAALNDTAVLNALQVANSQALGFLDGRYVKSAGFGVRWKTPEDYGAIGDGVTNDTAAMQSFVTAVCNGHLWGRLSAGKNYRITAALTVPMSSDWDIEGVGSATITQVTDNTPIFWLRYQNTFRFTIKHIDFQWVNNQVSANTKAISVMIGYETTDAQYAGYGLNHFKLAWLRTWNGYATVAEGDHSQQCLLWNGSIEDVVHQNQCTGPALLLDPYSVAGGGAPNVTVDRIYVRMDNIVGPGLILGGISGLAMRAIEFNAITSNSPIVMSLRGIAGGVLQAWRIEQPTSGVPAAGVGFLELSGCKAFSVDGLDITNLRITPAGTKHALVRLTNSCHGVTVRGVMIHGLTVDSGVTFSYVSTDGSTCSFDYSGGFNESSTGTINEVDNSLTASTYQRIVDTNGKTAFNGPTANADVHFWGSIAETLSKVNDVSYTVAAHDRNIMFTGLTATRQVTLPAPTGNYGRRITVINGTNQANQISVVAADASTINGSASNTFIVAYGRREYICDGTNWRALLTA